MKRALAFVLVGASFAGGGFSAERSGAVAIKDAHVVTVSGEEWPRATVVLRDGLISDVGTGVAIPADAWVIDGAGLTVYPGFIDALSSWGIPQPAAAANRGSATAAATASTGAPEPRAKGPEDRPQTYSFERAADLVAPTDSRLEIARAAGFTSAATYPTRGIFEGLGALVDLGGERGRDMIVAQPIGQRIAFRLAGFGRAGFPASLMGNISYVRQMFLDLEQYEQAKQIYASNPTGNRRPEYDHALEGLAESPRLLLPADERQQIDRMLSFGKELKKPFLLYGLHEGYERIDELKQANVPVIVLLKWPEKARDGDPADVSTLRELTMRDQAPAVPGLLAKAGVRFAFSTEGIENAGAMKKALKHALDSGLTPKDAVRALTLSPAEIYGVADRLGSIDKGKIANVVVMKGDLFDEKTTVEYVFVDGNEFKPSKELQRAPSSGGAGKRAATPSEEMEQ